MTIAVEPMVNIGGYEVKEMPNGWTVVTADGSLSAHYENTILIQMASRKYSQWQRIFDRTSTPNFGGKLLWQKTM